MCIFWNDKISSIISVPGNSASRCNKRGVAGAFSSKPIDKEVVMAETVVVDVADIVGKF